MPEAAEYEQFGSYRLTHLLGKGGMASVYRALRSGPMGFSKEVAIKRLHDALANDEKILKALINEARLGGQLKHPNIVEVYVSRIRTTIDTAFDRSAIETIRGVGYRLAADGG